MYVKTYSFPFLEAKNEGSSGVVDIAEQPIATSLCMCVYIYLQKDAMWIYQTMWNRKQYPYQVEDTMVCMNALLLYILLGS